MRKIVLLLILCLGLQPAAAQSVKVFQPGDQVVFAGNSITEAGFYEYYIWLYYLTHFPETNLRIFNGGIGGDVAGQLFDRLPEDILTKKPTVLVVTFGMNDSKYFEYLDTTQTRKVRKAAVDSSYASFLKIERFLKARPGIRTIIMSSSPYDETMRNKDNYFPGKSITLDEIAGFQKEVAARNNWEYVDLLHPMLSITDREQAKDPAFTLTGPDRIHPGNAGHFVMAYLFLKAQGLAGKPVADVAIQAKNGKVTKSENAEISDINPGKEGLSFRYLAGSLPYPIDTVPRVWQNPQTQRDALEVIPFTREFNQERISINGLEAGSYILKIDGKPMGNFSADQLDDGLNIAEITYTPQYRQSLQLMELARKHRELESKFRSYYWVNYNFLKAKNLLFDDSDAAADTIRKYQEENVWLKMKTSDYEQVRVAASRKQLQAEMKALRDEMYRLNHPKEHLIAVVRDSSGD